MRREGVEVRMIKRLTQWQARPGLDRDAAVRYWTVEHVGLVARVPHLLGYVQDVALPGPDGADPPYAGLGEAWFATVEEAQLATESPEWAAVIEDARTFMDFDRLVVAWARENVAVPPRRERSGTKY
jgi:uncharacterized protein (TIGR02118 family)